LLISSCLNDSRVILVLYHRRQCESSIPRDKVTASRILNMHLKYTSMRSPCQLHQGRHSVSLAYNG
ncbi:potassium voltage-gated channel protein Shaw-like X1, partial [Biomphalaria glabrata]